MLVCYRDDGFWTLLWYACFRRLIGGPLSDLPGKGFVGQVSASFQATGARRARLTSTRMRRIHSTDDARLWRLTCVWEVSKDSAQTQSGSFSGRGGRPWVGGGEAISRQANQESTVESRTISI